MKPSAFDYSAPSSIDDALRDLNQADRDPRVLAGGQSLLPLLNLRLARPSLLVDVKRIESGHEIAVTGSAVRIAFAVTQAEAYSSPEIAEHAPLVIQALAHVGNRETRNRGTVVGSIAHSDPTAELPAAMVALGAEYEVRGLAGTRRVLAEQFHIGPYLTALADGEMLTAVEIPRVAERRRCGFSEMARGPFAFCGLAAVRTEPPTDGAGDVRLVTVGVGGRPWRLRTVERAVLDGPAPSRVVREAVLDWARESLDCGSETRAKVAVLATLAERQIAKFLQHGERPS